MIVLMSAGLGVAAPSAGAVETPGVVVVDDDRAQCPKAKFTTIPKAVAAVRTGGTVQVCAGIYPGEVSITKRIDLVAKTPAATTVDCIAPTGPATTRAQALSIVQGAITVSTNDVTIDGLVVAGASTGITTSDRASGYRIRRNLVQGNTRFGIELQSGGSRRTIVEENCLRNNGAVGEESGAIVSELGALKNVVIRKNITADNFEGISVAGPYPHADISISDNILRREAGGIAVSGTVASDITGNAVDAAGAASSFAGLAIGGGNLGLTIASNTVTGSFQGIFFDRSSFNDVNAGANVGLVVIRNHVHDNDGGGILSALPAPNAPGNLVKSLTYFNTTDRQAFSGISLAPGSDDNVLIGNTSTANGSSGIALRGAVGNLVRNNTMTGNAVHARDDARDQNTWLANDCVTELTSGAPICN